MGRATKKIEETTKPKSKKKSKKVAKAPHDWTEWWMAPLMPRYEKGVLVDEYYVYNPGIVLAPDIDEAFVAARCRWPSADSGWICLGGVSAKDREVNLKIPESGVMQLLKFYKEVE